MEHLLSSPAFRTAPALKKFLRYAVVETLEGRGSLLKEYSLGIEVFGRGESFDPRSSNIVRVEASKLRTKLTKYYENEGLQDQVRIDFPKGGYAASFRWNVIATTQLNVAAEEHQGPLTGEGFVFSWKIAAVILIVLAAAWAVYLFRYPRGARPAPASVAVLPFVNLNGNGDDFLSDGLTEDLIGSLARVPGAHVVARTSVFGYKGKAFDVRKIGQDLNVRSVLEGTVRQSGTRLRITARLSDAGNGYQLWASTYDRELKDALMVQREIADSIASALGIELARRAAPSWPRESPGEQAVNPGAYQAYLKGRFFWNKNTPDTMKTAIRYFEEAIRLEPAFALPYTGLAHCYTALAVMTNTPSAELIPKIRAAASTALELDSALGEAHLDLAEAYLFDFDWGGAESEFRKGLDLSPGDAMSHRWYAFYLEKMGRMEDASIETKRALDLDPISAFMTNSFADSLYYLRRYDAALEQYRKALELDPNFGMMRRGMGLANLRKGNYAEGIKELQAAQGLMGSGPYTIGHLGYAYAVSGNTMKAREILATLLDQFKRAPSPAQPIATIYIGLEERDKAFEWLRKAVDQREVSLDLKSDPLYDPLRSDPRFTDLLRRMKLA